MLTLDLTPQVHTRALDTLNAPDAPRLLRLCCPAGDLWHGTARDGTAALQIVRALCKELDERFLCPMRSPALTITVKRGARVRPGTDAREAAIGAEAEAATAPCDQLSLECRDGSTFSFPLADCALLPIAHTSAEELAAYLCHAVIERFTLHALQVRCML